MKINLTQQQIIDFRKKADLTQAELAYKLHVNAMTVSRWERGETTPQGAGKANLLALMQAYDK